MTVAESRADAGHWGRCPELLSPGPGLGFQSLLESGPASLVCLPGGGAESGAGGAWGLDDVLTSDSPVIPKNLKFWNPRQHREADHFPFTSACNAEDPGSIYLGWEDPWEKGMAAHPVFLPGEFHGLRSLVGFSPWGHKESDTTECLSHTQKLS